MAGLADLYKPNITINLHNPMTLKNTNLTVLSKSENPQKLASQALHVCYSERPLSDVYNNKWFLRSESAAGKIVVDKCLKFGHWSILEMPHITFNVEGFPNSTMAQSRTHRHISHQCQSGRYTSKRFIEWALRYGGDITSSRSLEEFEKLFYIREMGVYRDRFGNKIDFGFNLSMAAVQSQAIQVSGLINKYLIDEKMPFEMFRSFIPADYRSNWVMGGNLRAWLHYLDMRLPKDSQAEIGHLANLVAIELEEWCPEVMEYYNKTRRNKNKLAT